MIVEEFKVGGRDIAITARALAKSFAVRDVLRDVNLDLACGEAVALMGINGAGKTTLLRILAGLCRPDRGEFRWFGGPGGNLRMRRRLGMLGHESALCPSLTIRENLLFAARMYGLRRSAEPVDRQLRESGLDGFGERLPRELPRGVRQRAAIARVVIHRPAILLLDEPLAGLDSSGTEQIRKLLHERRSAGTAILFTTHDRAAAEQLADRVLRLQAGRLIGLRTVREFEPSQKRPRETEVPVAWQGG